MSNFQSFGAVNEHLSADQGEIWQGGADHRTCLPNFTLISAMCHPCGEKRKNQPMSKNNTDRGALRAVLPVIKTAEH